MSAVKDFSTVCELIAQKTPTQSALKVVGAAYVAQATDDYIQQTFGATRDALTNEQIARLALRGILMQVRAAVTQAPSFVARRAARAAMQATRAASPQDDGI